MQVADSDCGIQQWALNIEKRRGRGKARVALARKLAIIMVAMWKTGEAYRPDCRPTGGRAILPTSDSDAATADKLASVSQVMALGPAST